MRNPYGLQQEWNTKMVDCQFDRLVKLLGDSDGSEGIDKRRGNEQERELSRSPKNPAPPGSVWTAPSGLNDADLNPFSK